MSARIDPAIICANPDCKIAETGKCVEGIERASCPHFGNVPDAANDSEETSRSLRLMSGGTLDVRAVSQLLRAGPTRVISIVGPSDAGKTSLIASVYDLFQTGPVAGLEFAGSRSLGEFEQTCHDARAASQRSVPHINRTPRGEVMFYHLDVGGGGAGSRLTLALADRAGEEYRGAINDVNAVSDFYEIGRSDTLTMLVDGERLLNVGARHNLRSEIIMILQALFEGGALDYAPRLAVVLTKIDLLHASAHRARAEADFTSLVAKIEELLPDAFATVRPFWIAASPKDLTVPRGTGVDDLLAFWLTPAQVRATEVPEVPAPTRAFGRLVPEVDE